MATVSQPQPETLTRRVGSNPPRLEEGVETLLALRLAPEMNRTVEALMLRYSLSKADVLNLAVGLLRAASEAVDQGKRVGIAGDDVELEVEFTGL